MWTACISIPVGFVFSVRSVPRKDIGFLSYIGYLDIFATLHKQHGIWGMHTFRLVARFVPLPASGGKEPWKLRTSRVVPRVRRPLLTSGCKLFTRFRGSGFGV